MSAFLHYNVYTDTFIEGMPLTSDPAPFLEIYYVPVRMCGTAVSLVFLPDKRALLCILSQSGKYDVWKYSSKYSPRSPAHSVCIHCVRTHSIIADHSVKLLIITLSHKFQHHSGTWIHPEDDFIADYCNSCCTHC